MTDDPSRAAVYGETLIQDSPGFWARRERHIQAIEFQCAHLELIRKLCLDMTVESLPYFATHWANRS